MWDPAAVSRTARRLRLPSEAARRYERDIDPAISVAALDRCATLLADIAGGEVSPKLTDWRGDPPRDDWSLPPVRHRRRPARPHGRGELPRRHDGPTADPDRRPGQRCRRQSDRDAAELAARPAAAGRPGRGGAAAGGAGGHPVGVAVGSGRSGTVRRAAPPPRDRQVAGAVGLCRDPADAVPAGRGVRCTGVCPPTMPAAAPRRCSTRWRPIGRIWLPRCCRACWRRWRATPLAASWTSRCSRSRRWCSRPSMTKGVELIPVRSPSHRRRDRGARRVAAAAARACRGGADRAARTARPVGRRPSRGCRRRLRGRANDRRRQRGRGDAAGRPVSAVASGPLREAVLVGRDRASGTPGSCIRR